jgi:hypothetical protein
VFFLNFDWAVQPETPPNLSANLIVEYESLVNAYVNDG